MRFLLVSFGCVLWFVHGPLARAELVDYVRDIKPLLAKHCYTCHSPLRQKSGFRMDTIELLIQGGELGAAVVPGKSAESRLIQAVLGSEGMSRMPPEGSGEPLTPEQVVLLRRWIDEGAQGPVEPPLPDPRKHWAFQAVQRPSVPQAVNTEWAQNPIDAFVAAEHARHGLKPRPEADPHHLLRRVYLNLTGLPPGREALQAFLSDPSPLAYEEVVEQLLASPHYGERWGRHWMDVWRYSDWAGWGQQVRDSQPHIWHWRDWIIESLNADRPYDEMVVDMLAADELAPTDRDRLRATGFLARNFKLLSREQWLQDTVEHTAKAFVGLTMNCARCHDHMTDPVDQDEYYQFRAIFEPHHVRLDRLPGVPDTTIDALPRVFDKDLAAATYFYPRGDERAPQKDRVLAPGVPSLLRGIEFQINEVTLPREASHPLLQAFVIQDDLAASEKKVEEARNKADELKTKSPVDEAAVSLAELQQTIAEARHASLLASVAVERIEEGGDKSSESWAAAAKAALQAQRQLALAEGRRDLQTAQREQQAAQKSLEAARKATGQEAPDDKHPKIAPLVAKLTAADKKLSEAQAKHMQAETAMQQPLTTEYTKREIATYPEKSSGRRLALARWITHPQNPLAARVAVNHLWSRHFGSPLVPSVFNFGLSGDRPINQPLLDWLASELVDPQHAGSKIQPWSMKHIHRLIVTSQTYRLSSTSDPENEKVDPDNQYLWRAPTRRMEAEVVRDSVFHVAGQLDLTMGGPDLDHARGLSIKRRSLYFRHAAEKQMLMLKLFDCASVGECYKRSNSVIPQQALALANSELTLVQARLLARKLNDMYSSENEPFIQAAVEQVLARPFTDAERSVCVKFLEDQQVFFEKNRSRLTEVASEAKDGSKPSGDPRLRAREQLVHALFNHNDFVVIR